MTQTEQIARDYSDHEIMYRDAIVELMNLGLTEEQAEELLR